MAIAEADGFIGGGYLAYRGMFQWFESVHGLPFTGTLIRWRLLPRGEWAKP